jgi:hypothetical protein
MTFLIQAAPQPAPAMTPQGQDVGTDAPPAEAFRDALAAALGAAAPPRPGRPAPDGHATPLRGEGGFDSVLPDNDLAAALAEPPRTERLATPTGATVAPRNGDTDPTTVAGAREHRSEGDTRRETSEMVDTPALVITPVSLPSLPPMIRAGDVHARTDSLDVLVPEFRGRLERVITRMEEEFGYTVEVIETSRSQERQDALYAQGRSSAGPIVTWTRASRHTHGIAADVTIDGGWDDRAAFARLGVIAREEGLRTLGARDPGHIELPLTNASMRREAEVGTHRKQHLPTTALPGVGHASPVATGTDAVDRMFERPVPGAAFGHHDTPATTGDARRRSMDGAPGDRVRAHALTPLPAMPSEVHALPMPREAEAGLTPRFPGVDHTRPAVDRRVLQDSPGSNVPQIGRGRDVAGALQGLHLPPSDLDLVANLREHDGRGARVGMLDVATLRTSRDPGLLRVADVAAVATLAPVAQVAAVAHAGWQPIAPNGARTDAPVRATRAIGTSESLRQAQATDGLPTPVSPREVIASAEATAFSRLTSTGERLRGEVAVEGDARSDDSGPSSSERSFADVLPAFDREAEELYALVGEREGLARRDGATGVQAIERTDAAERIARALRLQDAADERPMSSVTLRLDHPEGGEDRIRVDLRGRSVGATLDITDAGAADHMRAHTHELQQALERRGLDGERVVVRATSDAMQGLASAAGGEREGVRAATASQGASGQGSTTRDQRAPKDPNHPQRDHDQPASRQRRDQGAHR